MKRWYFWAGLLVSALFLFLALRGLQLDQLWETIQSADYWWLFPAVGVYFIAVWVRAWRWHYLLSPLMDIPTKEIFPIVSIGYMGNNIFPARAGELVRSALLKRKHNISISSSLATILVERIFDGIVVLGFIFINLGELFSTGNFRAVAFWGALIFSAALMIILGTAMYPSKAQKAILKIINWLIPIKWREKASDLLNQFVEGLAALRSWQEILMVTATSTIIWVIEACVYWLVMQAFPFQVSFLKLVFMNGVVNLATSLPSAPGYIGTFDAPGIALLKSFGVSPSLAAGYTLLLHATLWLPITVWGGVYFLREGIDWSEELDQARKGRNST